MASIDKKELINKSITATETSAKKSLDQGNTDFIATLIIANYLTITTIDVVVQHSPDGVNWFTLATFAQASGNTTELINITANVLANIRAVSTVVDAGSADVVCELHFEAKR